MANLLDLVKKLRDNLSLSNQQSPYNQALNKLSAGTAGFRKNTTDLVIGKPLEVAAIGLMGDKRRASYKPVFYNEKDTLKSYSGDVARGALNTALMGKGLTSPKMLATVTGLNTGFATGGAAYSNTKKPQEMRVNPLMTGIKDTATNFPRLSQSAGLYSVSNPFTDKILKTVGVTSKAARLTGIGVGNIGEDITLAKLNKEGYTPQQAAVSFLTPFAFEGATQTFRAGGHGLEDVLAKLKELNRGTSSGAIDLNAKVSLSRGADLKAKLAAQGKGGTEAEILEAAGTWKNGALKKQFDTALWNKDTTTVIKLLPEVPLEYRRSFEAEIEKVVSQGKFQQGFARLNAGIGDSKKTPLEPMANEAEINKLENLIKNYNVRSVADQNHYKMLTTELAKLKGTPVGGEINSASEFYVKGKPEIKTKSQLTDIWNKANAGSKIDPLITEAKKYKSADEFVKAQGTPVYRGGVDLSKEKITNSGISVSSGKNVANDFVKQKGGTVQEHLISPEAKIINYADVPNVKFKNLNDYSPELDTGNRQIWRDLEVEYQKAVDWAKAKGYDGVKLPLEGETRIINPEVLKTKSQLTDIYNQAKVEATPPEKVPQTFRTEKFNVTSQEEQVLLKTLKGLGLDERDVRSFDEMRVIGEELLGDPRNLLKDIESGRIKDSEIVALGDIISTSSKRISTLTKSLKKNPADPKLLAQLDAEEALINQAIKKRVRGGTEAGRAVVAFRLLAKNNMEPTYWLTRAQRQLGDRPITQEQVNAINKLIESNDRLGIARFVSLLGESTTREKAVALWKAGLLTSPRTHLANIASNTLFAPLETIKDIPATGFDIVRSAITKTPRAKSFSTKTITSQGKGFLRGVDQAGKYLKEGVDPREVAKLDVYRQIRFGDTRGGRFAQKYVDGVFRFLGAEDKIFREMAFSRSLVDQAGVIAKTKNLSAGELNDLLSNPSKEMVDIAAKDAGVATFNNENALADAVRRFKSGDTALATATDFVMPFVRTPTNVVMRMIDYTPAGVTKTTVQKMLNKSSVTDRELADAFGRSATGLAVIWAGYQLANAGMFQGATPSSEAERSQMYLEGKNPGSILVNGTWYQINKLSPVYPLLSIGASLAESKSVYKAGLQGLKSVADSPFVMGMAGLTQAITDPERGGEKYVRSAVGGFTPNIVKDLARGGDVMRQQDTMSDSLFGGLPGFRQNLPTRVDALGNVIPENNLGNALFNPLRPREATRDPVILELARVGYNLNYVGDTIGNTKLTPEQQRAYQRLAGAKIREILVPLFNSEKYASLDPDQQQTAIEKAVNKAKADAREEIKPKLSTIAKGSDRGSRIKAYENEGGEVSTLNALTKDPFGTLEALTSGQPIRKLRGNTVVLEREKGLASGDQGNKGTQVDHVVPLALGGGNKLRNQYILTASENNQKSVVESKLARELEAGTISKSEAKRRLKDWRSEVKDIPSKDMAAVTEEKQPTAKPTRVPTSIKSPVLRDIASRTYKGIWNDKKDASDDPISIELPELPKITGNADLDKTMISKFSSQLTTQSNNIVKLYQDGQLTAKEANDALVAIKELKATASAVTKKPKKAKKASKLVIKEIVKPSKTGASIKGLASTKAPAKVKISAYKPKAIKIAGKKYVKIKAKPFKNTFGSALTKLA